MTCEALSVPSSLEASDDLADESTLDAIWLHGNESSTQISIGVHRLAAYRRSLRLLRCHVVLFASSALYYLLGQYASVFWAKVLKDGGLVVILCWLRLVDSSKHFYFVFGAIVELEA